MFIVAIFIVVQRSNDPVSINWWTDKLNVVYPCTHVMEYYSTIKSNENIHTPVFRNNIIWDSKKWKQLNFFWSKRWMGKQNRHIYSMEYFSALKNEHHSDTCYIIDEPWTHYANEISQTQKTIYCMIPFIWNVQNS